MKIKIYLKREYLVIIIQEKKRLLGKEKYK